jgi:hypothetical protein
MPNFQDIFKNDVARGAALGIGAALVAVAALPAIMVATRPLARVALKSSLLLLEKGREAVAEAGEHLEDLVAEVKAELASERESFVESAVDAAQENSTTEA